MEETMKKHLVTAILLSATFGTAPVLYAQQSEVLPSNPGQVAPQRPDFQQVLPGQQGTIPEIIERPGAMNSGQMVVSPENVRRAQEALKTKGYNPGAASGNLHPGTQEALRSFQKDNDLPVTGVLDQSTAAKLGIDMGRDSNVPSRRAPESTIR
jgi:peptidoglycan hydrolase-like protein with peptidoglycan-binding domain